MKSSLPVARPTQLQPAPIPPRAPQPGQNNQGCGWALGLIAIVAVIGLLAQCEKVTSTNTTTEAAASYNQMADAIGNSISAQDKAPPQPLSSISVRAGAADYRVAMAAESLSGAMIYSQNCYDALAGQFSWSQLDKCGAFDMMTVRLLPENAETGMDKETAYFADETAAGRYLKAAIGAGEPTEEADARLADLQAKTARLPGIKPKPIPTMAPDEIDLNVSDQGNGE